MPYRVLDERLNAECWHPKIEGFRRNQTNYAESVPETKLLEAQIVVDEGHLLGLWRRSAVTDDTTAIGLYAADSEAQLVGLLGALPLADWMRVTVIPLAPHPNDPALVAR